MLCSNFAPAAASIRRSQLRCFCLVVAQALRSRCLSRPLRIRRPACSGRMSNLRYAYALSLQLFWKVSMQLYNVLFTTYFMFQAAPGPCAPLAEAWNPELAAGDFPSTAPKDAELTAEQWPSTSSATLAGCALLLALVTRTASRVVGGTAGVLIKR